MSKKDRDGMSKRERIRAQRRANETRNRWIAIGAIIIGALLVTLFFVYPLLKPVAAVQPAQIVEDRPQVNRNATGDPNAPVKLDEYSDFQCPFCKRFWTETEKQVLDSYVKTGKVLFTYHSAGNWVSQNINASEGTANTESSQAAMAAYCAADQGKFWEMHDALFTNAIGENAGSFVDRRLQQIAQNLGLDMTAFNSCYSNGKYKDVVDKDLSDATAAGISGTPFFVLTYVVNGQTQTVTIEGAQPFSEFQTKIDAALTAMGK
jgi:protein-disulfide isomerase